MKLGLGLYRQMLTPDNFRFARQAGATHIVAHWVDYFSEGPRLPAAESKGYGWGVTQNQGKLWSVEELTDLRKAVEAEGLTLAAIENLDPSHWHDVLLDGPKKLHQLEDLKTIVRNMGRAGIPILGFHFMPNSVWRTDRMSQGGAGQAAPSSTWPPSIRRLVRAAFGDSWPSPTSDST